MYLKKTERVIHPLDPIVDTDSRVLILGSLPSPRSREQKMYYGNLRNRFWAVLAALWNEPLPTDNDAKIAFCYTHHVALWDVIHSCQIHGASDASIKDVEPNDVAALLKQAPITTIFTTGGAAQRLYHRYLERSCGMKAVALPSTSPANARYRLDDLIAAYRPVRSAAEADTVL